MKKLLYILALVSLTIAIPVLETGCQTAPDARHVQYATLKALGDTADAVVALSSHLYKQGEIDSTQANAIKDFYDWKFRPVYMAAVVAAKSDLSSVASPDLLNLAAQLSSLLGAFQPKTP